MKNVNYILDLSISHLLLDESQDTNPESWEIISSITEEFFTGFGTRDDMVRTIFVVGDQKQSIFSFQGANLEHFFHYKEYFKQKSKDAKIDFKEINLETSYRSSQNILNFVDNFCNKFENKKAFYLENDINKYNIKHIAAQKNNKSFVEEINKEDAIKIVDIKKIIEENNKNNLKNKKIFDKTDWLAKTNSIIENEENKIIIENVVNKILFLINDKNIPLNEIMTIFRKTSSKNSLIFDIIAELKKYHIRTILVGNLDDDIYWSNLIALFRFIALSSDSLNLGSLLKSDLFNLNDEDIFMLRNIDFSDTLFDNLKEYSLNEKFDDNKVKDSFNKLNCLINLSKNENILMVVLYVYNNILPNLIECKIQMNEIYHFYIEKIVDIIQNSSDILYANNYDELIKEMNNVDITNEIKNFNKFNDEKSILFTTAHSSKGLEAENVLFLDIGNDNASKLHKNPIMFLNNNKLWYYTNSKSLLIQDEILKYKECIENEEIRLKYVIFTRSKDMIYHFC